MSNRKNPRIRARRRSYKPLWTLLGVLVVIAIIVFVVVQLGIPQRNLAAMYVGDEKVTVAEWNYYYNQEKMAIAQSLGVSPLHINLKEESPFGDELGETWGELLDNATRRRIQQTYVKKQEIEAIGETFTEEDRLEVDSALTQLRLNFIDEGQLRTYLEQTYGIGVTPELLEKIESNNLMARKFDSNYRESMEFSDEEIKEFYDANPEEYQVVKYHLIQVDTTAGEDVEEEHTDGEAEVAADAETETTEDEIAEETEATEEVAEETEATDEVIEEETVEEVTDEGTEEEVTEGEADETEETADDADRDEQESIDEMLKVFDEDLKKSSDFKELAREYEDQIVTQSAAVRNSAGDDVTYFERSRDSIYPEAVRTWLYDEAREAGEVTRIDVEDTAYYVLFVDMAPDDTLTADITYRYFPTAHSDNSQMTVHEVEQLRAIAEDYAEGIESAEDLEVGPEAEIVMATESVTDTTEETTDTDETADAESTDEEAAEGNDETDVAEDAEATDETDAADETDATDTTEATDEEATDSDATETETEETETEDATPSVPVTSYGPYTNEEVHTATPLVAEVTAAALDTEAGETTVVVTFNGIYVVYVDERGPKEDWEARAEQDLSLERFNAQLTGWLEEDERYEVREGSLGRFFTE